MRLLVAIAVAIPAVLMATLTARALAVGSSCTSSPVTLNVAVSPDLAPAVAKVGQVFNGQHRRAGGRCAKVNVTAERPPDVAAQVDGQHASRSAKPVDAWIPDSSLWVGIARSYPLGAQRVQPTGTHVALSPLVIVMPPTAAAQVPAFNTSVGWRFLLPPRATGPAYGLRLRVELPDPTQSAVGLETLIEIRRLLGSGSNVTKARARFTKFTFAAQPSASFDNPGSLAAFVSLARPPVNAHPVTVTTEQAVLTYDAAHPGQPLAARYPNGPASALGSPDLDYPYVLTSANPATRAAAIQFEGALRQGYARSVVRYHGFRTADGTADAMPAADGLSGQLLQTAPPPSPGEAQATLQAFLRLAVGSRDLAVMDVSAAMAHPSGVPGLTLEKELTQTADLGLQLFPDSAQIGQWEFADHLVGSRPYKAMVPVGPLPSAQGVITRRQRLEQANATLRPHHGTRAALNDTILAAYKQMLATYQPHYTNAVLMLTAGLDNAPGDISVTQLMSKIRALYNPDRRVELIILLLGKAGNQPEMQRIAGLTGGAAYQITDPKDVAKVFFKAVARRICQSGCHS